MIVSSFILRPAVYCYSGHSIHSLVPFNCSLYQLQVDLGQLAIGQSDAFYRGEYGNKGEREARIGNRRDGFSKKTAPVSKKTAEGIGQQTSRETPRGKGKPQNRIPFGSLRRLHAYKQRPFLITHWRTVLRCANACGAVFAYIYSNE